MEAKIVTIEGTDCSGKETQSKILEGNLIRDGYKVKRFSFPDYESPTGKIVGGSYLGKPEISPCVFPEGAVNVDPIVASLYYAADRRYAFLNEIESWLKENDIIILDRYVTSNLGHQGSKIRDLDKQDKFFETIYELEFKLCELPQSDLTLFLHMPLEAAKVLKKNRELLDQHEKSDDHLIHAERTYLRLAEKYGWKYINCLNTEKFIGLESIKTPNQISEEVRNEVNMVLTNKHNDRSKMTRF